jgi:hypothetical protein
MSGFPSDARRPLNRQRTRSELDASNDDTPLVSMGVLGRFGLLLLIVFGFALAAQLLVGAPH